MKELYHGTIARFDEIDVNAGKGYIMNILKNLKAPDMQKTYARK